MKISLFIYIFSSALVYINSLQCVDEVGNPVDWYVVYKLPEIKHHNKFLKAGVAYMYMTSVQHESWIFSNVSINSTKSIIANTLQGLYNDQKNISYILYNDEPPNRKKSDKGHTKGVVMLNNTNGFWLIHSVPHFPVLGKTYIYPRTGAVYGQSFICISMDLSNMNQVGIQLQYNNPDIYLENIDTNLKTSLPDLTKAAENITINQSPWYHITNLISLKGTQFLSFAKSKGFKKDLYESLVAPALETNLLVETWPNGPGKLPSDCTTQFEVLNIKSIFISSVNVSFTTTNDHSKWAVTPPSDTKYWICIGDINRAEHQTIRGGGTVCMNSKQIATNYNKCVEVTESCNKTSLF